MSFVEIYNEQLFDLLLPPEAYSSATQQQRRFSVYGGKESAVGGKRNTPLSSVQRLVGELEVGSAGGSGSGSGLHAPLTTTPGARQRMADLAIYERPDGSTYVKVGGAQTLLFLRGERASVSNDEFDIWADLGNSSK